MEVKGDLVVKRTLASHRSNQSFSAEALTAQRDLTANDCYWFRITNASTQHVVLPTTDDILLGWKVVIDVPTTSGASVDVRTYGESPTLLKNILAGRAYEFTLVDATDTAGTWQINFLEEADRFAASRYVATIANALSAPAPSAAWSAASSGYYTITITAATHGAGTSPKVQVFELSGTDYIEIFPDQVKVLANGNVTVRVAQTPDCRFEGKVVIM
jgi:hypothetical protein